MPGREAGLWERWVPHVDLPSHQGSEDGTGAGLLHGVNREGSHFLLWGTLAPLPSTTSARTPDFRGSGGAGGSGPPGLTHHQLGVNCSMAPQVSFLGQGRQSSLKRAEKRGSCPLDMRMVVGARKGI